MATLLASSMSGMKSANTVSWRMLARKRSWLARANRPKLSASRRKIWVTLMPLMLSWRLALIRATRTRTSRNASRMRTLKTAVAQTIAGSTAKLTSARRQFRPRSRTTTPISVKTSRRSVMTIVVNISCRTSTSFVARVTSLPTGFLSKNESDSRCRWASTFMRMSYITRCEVTSIMLIWKRVNTNVRRSAARNR